MVSSLDIAGDKIEPSVCFVAAAAVVGLQRERHQLTTSTFTKLFIIFSKICLLRKENITHANQV